MASGNVYDYTIQLASEASNPDPYEAVIYLHTSLGTAFLYFYPDTATLPDNGIRVQHGEPTYDVRYHSGYLPIIVDVLRNEKPVYFFFDDRSKYAGIRTGSEPVGEAE